MVSLRGRIALSVVKKFMNINPAKCQDQVKRLQKMNFPDKYKAPKGWIREKVSLGEGVAMEFVKPPQKKNNNLILVLHGGAYIIGLTDTYRQLSKIYSEAANGGAVAFLDYRVAPDYKYPSALEDAIKGWDKLLELGYQASDIVIVGDSAGGNLTLALMLKLRDEGRELPQGAVCMSPWADMTASGESYLTNVKLDPMFGADLEVGEHDVDKFLNCEIFSFVGDADRKCPFVSPVYGDYHGFPPMMFLAGTTELLLSDTLTIVEKLKKEGNEPELLIGEKMFHVWPLYPKLFPEARKAMQSISAFISNLYK